MSHAEYKSGGESQPTNYYPALCINCIHTRQNSEHQPIISLIVFNALRGSQHLPALEIAIAITFRRKKPRCVFCEHKKKGLQGVEARHYYQLYEAILQQTKQALNHTRTM